jgi:hypothetical protein
MLYSKYETRNEDIHNLDWGGFVGVTIYIKLEILINTNIFVFWPNYKNSHVVEMQKTYSAIHVGCECQILGQIN